MGGGAKRRRRQGRKGEGGTGAAAIGGRSGRGGGARVCAPPLLAGQLMGLWAPPKALWLPPVGSQGPLLGLLAKGPGPKLEEQAKRRKFLLFS